MRRVGWADGRSGPCVLPAEQDVPGDGVVRRAFEMEKRRRQNPRSMENWTFVSRLCAIQEHLLPGKVLDVGSAEGLFSCELAVKGWQVTAVDIHPQFIRYLCQKMVLNQLPIDCVQADATSLPFPDGTYDGVILGEILEHQTAPRAVLREAGRLLRLGGRLIVTTPVYPFFAHRSFSQWEQTREPAEDVPEDKSPDRHVFEFTPDELRSLAEAMGFELLLFAFVDTRLWESRLRRFRERALLPEGLFRLGDRLIIWLNTRLGPSILPRLLRARQMVAVLGRGQGEG